MKVIWSLLLVKHNEKKGIKGEKRNKWQKKANCNTANSGHVSERCACRWSMSDLKKVSNAGTSGYVIIS